MYTENRSVKLKYIIVEIETATPLYKKVSCCIVDFLTEWIDTFVLYFVCPFSSELGSITFKSNRLNYNYFGF